SDDDDELFLSPPDFLAREAEPAEDFPLSDPAFFAGVFFAADFVVGFFLSEPGPEPEPSSPSRRSPSESSRLRTSSQCRCASPPAPSSSHDRGAATHGSARPRRE